MILKTDLGTLVNQASVKAIIDASREASSGPRTRFWFKGLSKSIVGSHVAKSAFKDVVAAIKPVEAYAEVTPEGGKA